jgi:hypothetical protein
MTVRTESNLPAAMHVETARCLFAIDLGKQSWVMDSLRHFPRRSAAGS